MQIVEHLEEHYEVQEVPFARSYKWCPESVTIECDCGERLIFKASAAFSSSVVLCKCGADYTADIQKECQRHQPEVLEQTLEAYETAHHPWLHDVQAQEGQHQRDEAAYPEDSSWRYNDITLHSPDDERNEQ